MTTYSSVAVERLEARVAELEQKLEAATDALRAIAECLPNAGNLSTQPVGIARATLAVLVGGTE